MAPGGSTLSRGQVKSVGVPWWLSIVTRGPKLDPGGSRLSLEVRLWPDGSLLSLEVR